MTSIVSLDTRGRLVIPNQFREALDIKEGDKVLLSLDLESKTLMVSPVADEKGNLAKMEIIFGDTAGSLSRVAAYLAKKKIDLVMTSSRSIERTNTARWDIIADVSQCKISFKEMETELLEKRYAKKVAIESFSRECLHPE